MNYLYSDTDDANIAVSAQETMLQSSLKAGIKHTHVCGGKGRCSTCRVEVIEGLEHCLPRNEAEQKMESLLGLPKSIRLACQTKIQGDVKIRRLSVDDLDARIIKDQLKSHDDNSLGREKEVAVLFTEVSLFFYAPCWQFGTKIAAIDFRKSCAILVLIKQHVMNFYT